MRLIFKKIQITRFVKLLFVLSFICFLVILPNYAGACGWAGDGESDDDDGTIYIGADGREVEDQANPLDDPKIQTILGNSHRKVMDYQEAARWFRMAASQGFEPAQNNLAVLYEQGLGIAKNDILAVQWYGLAAEQGNAKAQHSLGQMYIDGRGVMPDKHLAAKWILKSAENGHVSAMEKIANMFFEGKGVLKDEIRAYKWWKFAAMHGKSSSEKSLGMAKTKMAAKAIESAEKLFADSHIPLKKQAVLGLYLTAGAAYKKWESNPLRFKILDTRTPGEYIFVGHGSMAYNIPVNFLDSKQKSGPKMVLNENFVSNVKKKFKETDTIFIICRSGVRSALAVNILARAGFKKAYSIIDGFEGNKLKNKDNSNHGKRVINGWKNAHAPWTYDLKPGLSYSP